MLRGLRFELELVELQLAYQVANPVVRGYNGAERSDERRVMTTQLGRLSR